MYSKLQLPQPSSSCPNACVTVKPIGLKSVYSHLSSLFGASNRALGKWGSRARHFGRQRRVLAKRVGADALPFPQAACKGSRGPSRAGRRPMAAVCLIPYAACLASNVRWVVCWRCAVPAGGTDQSGASGPSRRLFSDCSYASVRICSPMHPRMSWLYRTGLCEEQLVDTQRQPRHRRP